MRRHDGRNPVDVNSETVEQAADVAGDERTPEQLLTRATLDADLQAALDGLPDAFRQAVWLRDVEEFTYAEIARMIDVPIGTVMSRISRGRRMLYERLAPKRGGAAARAASGSTVVSARERGRVMDVTTRIMAECRDLEPLFAAYVDGEAGPGDCAAVDAHLRTCPRVPRRVAGERAVREASWPGARASGCASARPAAPMRGQSCTRTPAAAHAPGVFSRQRWCRCRWPPRWCSPSPAFSSSGSGTASKRWHAARRRSRQVLRVRAAAARSIPDAKALGREWAQARGWTLKVPDKRAGRAAGAARCPPLHLDRRHDGAPDVQWRGQPLSVYVLNSEIRASDRRRELVETARAGGVIWSKGGRTYAIVARGRPSDSSTSRCTCNEQLNSTVESRDQSRATDRGLNNMMNTRWMIAAAGAIGVGVLTVSALLGPTSTCGAGRVDGVATASTAPAAARPTSRRISTSPSRT